MNKILSWKIKAGVYAYIYLPEQTTHISTRIPEDSEKWHTIIGAISKWEESEYKHNFDIMADEAKKRYGVTIPWKDEYFNFADGNYVNDVNIIMLAGDDGGGEGSGSIGDGIGGEKDVFDEFNDMIKAEIESMAAAINAKNEEVKAFVEQKVTETISEAKNTIAETNKELDNVRTDLLDKLSGATEAIERASALFDLGEGNITAEDIQNALISVDEYGGWMSAYSANVINMWTDYDAINQEMGSVGDAVDAKKGLFTKIATHIDTINETVGTVEDTVNASLGLAQTVATWVDASASTVTDAKSWIDAKNGIISDTLNYINGDEDDTRSLKHDMNVLSGTILSEASTRIDGRVTNVMSEINAMSASVTTQITQLGNGVDSALTSVGNKIEAVCGTVKTWITKTEELSGTAKDLRDEWTTQSGMIRSVSDMVAETDEYGCVLGYVIVEETDERIELYKRINDDVHESVMDLEPNVWYKIGTREKLSEELQPLASAYYSFKLGSYISQKADEVVMSVVDDSGKTAAIRAAVSGDTALVGIVADKIIMSGDVVMGSMSALTANIGGILIGNGEIKTIKGVDDKTGMGSGQTSTFHLDGRTGGFSASGAYIRGEIEATSLTLCGKGENGSDTSFEEYLDGKIPTSENIYQQVYNFINSEEFENMLSDGFITYDEMYDYVDSLDLGLSENETKDLVEKMVNARVPNVETKTENGVTTHTYSYVDENGERHENTWTTIENGDYVVLDKGYTGNSGTFIFSKDGLLQANNAIIYGEIHANTGEIGGFSLMNNEMRVYSSNTKDTVAFLSGNGEYKDNYKGNILFGAGISKGLKLYKYTCNSSDNLNVIYLDSNYTEADWVWTPGGMKLNAYDIEVKDGKKEPILLNLSGGSVYFTEITDYEGENIEKRYVVRCKYPINGVTKTFEYTYVDGGDELFPEYTKEETINTKIYYDGTIETNRLTAHDGYFNGEINADGNFSGRLKNVTGTLNGVEINNSKINGNMDLSYSSSITARDTSNNKYFTLENSELGGSETTQFVDVASLSWYAKNSNGKNSGQNYSGSKELFSFNVKKGETVVFNKLSGEISRYTPSASFGSLGGGVLVYIDAVAYSGTSKTITLMNSLTKVNSTKKHGTDKTTINTSFEDDNHSLEGVCTFSQTKEEISYTFACDAYIYGYVSYSIHLPTYTWFGLDKASCKITLNGKKIKIKNNKIPDGVHISSNGIIIKSGGIIFKILNGKLTITCDGATILEHTSTGGYIKPDSGMAEAQ